MSELVDLKLQVEQLKATVRKQTSLLSSTGQQVLDLQLSAQKKKLQSLPNPTQLLNQKPSTSVPINENAVTNEDIEQLVGELQYQLDFLEERSIRRGINLTKLNDDELLAPLPDSDGNEPKDFPKTLKEFEAIEDGKVLEFCDFYQILPQTDEAKQKVMDFLDQKVEQLKLDEKNEKSVNSNGLDDLYNTLARYIGVRDRRGKPQW